MTGARRCPILQAMARGLYGVVAAGGLIVLSALAGPARAAEDDAVGAALPVVPQMDHDAATESLLDKLAAAGSADEAKSLEARVREAWRRSGSDTVDLLLGRANQAMKDGSHGLALQYLDTVVTLRPEFAEGWNMRATVYYLLDEYDLSIADIEQVLSLQPRHFGALTGLGTIFRELEQPKQALEVFRRALVVNPYLESARESVRKLEQEVEGREI